MKRVNLFKNNTSQAVRLPKPVAFPESVKQVDVVALGRSRLLTPAGETWDSWFKADAASEDFMCDRGQPEQQERDNL